MTTPKLLSAIDDFDRSIWPSLVGDNAALRRPRLHLVLSSSASGRSRATGALEDAGVVLNSRDLEVMALATASSTAADSNEVAAQWIQRGLRTARERRVNVTLEGTFRSPALVVGLARMFADAGYETHVATVAERVAEVRMADASRRFGAELHQRRTSIPPIVDRDLAAVAPLLAAVVEAKATDRVTILDRAGGAIVDSTADDPEYALAADSFTEAAARPLGTLRSSAWLSELRHMTRFLAQQGSAPRWAVDELIALHETALSEIVPELPIPADSETKVVQVARLSESLAILRNSVTSAVPEDPTASIAVAQTAGVDLGR